MQTNNDARFWDRAARKYAASTISDPAGYERTLERARYYLKPADVALEVGCGTGTTALRLAPSVARLAATDISNEMLAIAREKAQAQGLANVEFVCAPADASPWPNASFDAAMAFNLLHLVRDRPAVLGAIHRLLKPGALFISKTPSIQEMNPLIRLAVPLMQAIGQAPYVGIFSAEQLEREVEAAGFEIIERARHASRGQDVRPFLVARASHRPPET
ncbi:possible methyltransferases [alpha proteobacterium U9-1i]|nr:possible methyltransferases [alpha proteobacterium U9-1i]